MTGPDDLAASNASFLIAPAGCGKTELIARAISRRPAGRQLVLTHTHAGVGALRSRLVRFGAEPKSFRVDTIAGFALRLAAGYPKTSGLSTVQPTGKAWSQVYSAAARVVDAGVGAAVVSSSYDGVYVDEYQDCTIDQHHLILRLADVLPCRILGDPLQGIFGFAGKLVDWEVDVRSRFVELEPLSIPWRWSKSSPELGEWLLSTRQSLLDQRPLDLANAPISVDASTPAKQVLACHRYAREGGSVVGIRKWARDAHEVARRLGGRFTSMEEMDCNDLTKFGRLLDSSRGFDRALVVLDFASTCMTEVSTAMSRVRTALEAGRRPRIMAGSRTAVAAEALLSVVDSDGTGEIARALRALRGIANVKVFRRELLSEMEKIVGTVADGSFEALADAAWAIRDRARHSPRRLEQRIISRTLLVKGLEFDRCLVLDANELDAKNLYVALTRGSTSLTVLTTDGQTVVQYAGASASK